MGREWDEGRELRSQGDRNGRAVGIRRGENVNENKALYSRCKMLNTPQTVERGDLSNVLFRSHICRFSISSW